MIDLQAQTGVGRLWSATAAECANASMQLASTQFASVMSFWSHALTAGPVAAKAYGSNDTLGKRRTPNARLSTARSWYRAPDRNPADPLFWTRLWGLPTQSASPFALPGFNVFQSQASNPFLAAMFVSQPLSPMGMGWATAQAMGENTLAVMGMTRPGDMLPFAGQAVQPDVFAVYRSSSGHAVASIIAESSAMAAAVLQQPATSPALSVAMAMQEASLAPWRAALGINTR